VQGCCVYCVWSDGAMQLFDEEKENLIIFVIKTQNLSREVAETVALSR